MTASAIAWVAELDGVAAGIAGIALYRPTRELFADWHENLRPHFGRMVLLRGIKRLGAAIAAQQRPVMARAHRDEPTAVRLLMSLGLAYHATDDEGDDWYARGV